MKYPNFKLEVYLAEREFADPINLCASDLETHTLEELLQLADPESLALWQKLALNYTNPKGHPLLCEEISKLYWPQADMQRVLCFAGAEEGIFCMAHALLEKGDHVVVVTPCYQSLQSLPETLASVTTVPLRYEEGWKLDLEKLAKAIQANTKLIVLNVPHNPTGAVISAAQQQAIIELARKHNLWIFCDEVYRYLELDPADRLPAIASVYEKGLSLSVMSKAYGLAGLRIGWIASQNMQILEKMGEIKHYLSICNSAPSEILSIMALRASKTLLTRNLELMCKNLKELNIFFNTHADWFEWVPPKAGSIAFPRFKATLSAEQMADELLKEANVLILPGSVFDYPGNHFRISFGRKSMSEALERFFKFIEKHKRNWKR